MNRVLAAYPVWDKYFENLIVKGWNNSSIQYEKELLKTRILSPPASKLVKIGVGIMTLPLGPVGAFMTGYFSHKESQREKMMNDALTRYNNFSSSNFSSKI